MSLLRTVVSPDDFSVVLGVDRTAGAPVLVVVIIGELDLATMPVLIESVAELDLDGESPEAVRFDLSATGFIDAVGLRALSTVAGPRPVHVVGAGAAARRLFGITGLDDVYRFD